jgi:cell division protein FtsN
MADNRTPRDERKKSYYSINLTDGRKFIIFIAFIIIIAVVFIGIFIVTSMNAKSKQNLSVTETSKSDHILPNYYSYTNEEPAKLILNPDSSSDSKVSTLTASQTTVLTKIDASSDKHQSVKEEPANNIDNSEVYYSSKFTADDDEVKSKTQTLKTDKSYASKNKTPENKIVKKSEKTEKIEKTDKTSKTNGNSKKNTKKYVVQIGSYTNKKTAEEIAAFYQNNGNYPTFVKDTNTKGKTFYRLRIGPFTDRSRAEKYLSYLKDTKYGKESYISEIFN